MSAELTAPMVHKSDAKRIVYGPVLIPDEPDSDGDIVTIEQIERVAHKFVEAYRNVDLQHTLQNVGDLLESYIAPVDLSYGDLTVPKGSWMMGVRVTDESTWDRVQKGELTGFSIMGIPAAMKSNTPAKRTTLADLGEAWVVNAVSLVDSPAVPKAKWVVVKSRHTSVKSMPGSFEHRRELIEDSFMKLFPDAIDRAYVYQLFEDRVILVHYNDEGEQYVDVPYLLSEDTQTVTFGEPTPVGIEEYVVPAESSPEPEAPAEKSDKPSFWNRVAKALGFGSTKEKEVDLDMTAEELKALIVDTVKEVLAEEKPEVTTKKKTPEEELAEGAEFVEEDKEVVTADPANPDELEKEDDKDPEDKEEEPEAKDEEKEKLKEEKEELEAALALVETQLSAMKSHRSKRLFGQDGDVVEKSAAPTSDRDAFGFKRN